MPRCCRLALCLALALCLTGCGLISFAPDKPSGPRGRAYTIRGKTYYPLLSAAGFTEVGVASWYGPGFHGRQTANGERYNMYELTAAHKILPFGTRLRVTHLGTGRSLVVRVNDRGPFVEGRIIDLSFTAARQLGIVGSGTARVRLEALDEGPLVTLPPPETGHELALRSVTPVRDG